MITEWAFAKVNLCLHVTGQRPDGYHLLDSIVAFAGIGDRLVATPAEISSLTLQGPFAPTIPADDGNSVMRAAGHFAPAIPLAFTLEKFLPPASGIGGGTADAAAAIRAILRLADQEKHDDSDNTCPAQRGRIPDLQSLAAFGADLPVCMFSHPARMRGIGERLDWLPGFPAGWITLVNPGVELPTQIVFRALDRKHNPPLAEPLPAWPDVNILAGWLAAQRNDLEPPAITLAPVIGAVLAALASQPGALIARMSGSGATCFALFDTEAAAQDAADAVSAAHPGWWAGAGPLFPGNPALFN